RIKADLDRKRTRVSRNCFYVQADQLAFFLDHRPSQDFLQLIEGKARICLEPLRVRQLWRCRRQQLQSVLNLFPLFPGALAMTKNAVAVNRPSTAARSPPAPLCPSGSAGGDLDRGPA